MDEIGAKYKATPAQVALNWVINSHGETIVTIPGVTKVQQSQENAGAISRALAFARASSNRAPP